MTGFITHVDNHPSSFHLMVCMCLWGRWTLTYVLLWAKATSAFSVPEPSFETASMIVPWGVAELWPTFYSIPRRHLQFYVHRAWFWKSWNCLRDCIHITCGQPSRHVLLGWEKMNHEHNYCYGEHTPIWSASNVWSNVTRLSLLYCLSKLSFVHVACINLHLNPSDYPTVVHTNISRRYHTVACIVSTSIAAI